MGAKLPARKPAEQVVKDTQKAPARSRHSCCRCADLHAINLARRDQFMELRPANACQLHRNRDSHWQWLKWQLRNA
jgi:hypothetical protein